MESSSWAAADARARPLFPWPAARSARVCVFPPSAVSPSPGPPPFVAPPAVSEEGGAGAAGAASAPHVPHSEPVGVPSGAAPAHLAPPTLEGTSLLSSSAGATSITVSGSLGSFSQPSPIESLSDMSMALSAASSLVAASAETLAAVVGSPKAQALAAAAVAHGQTAAQSVAQTAQAVAQTAQAVSPGAASAPPAPAAGSKAGKKEKKAAVVPEGIVPKPKLSKAERRAKQEAQRAAKEANKAEEGGSKGGGERRTSAMLQRPPVQQQHDVASKKGAAKKSSGGIERPEAERQVALFAHLPQYEAAALRTSLLSACLSSKSTLHPAITRLGLQFSQGLLTGANARCEAMLGAFQEMVRDYKTPPEKTLGRDLSTRLKHAIDFLAACRPLSVSMGNAIKYVKKLVVASPLHLPESEAKAELVRQIDWFLTEKIAMARRAVVELALGKIRDGDVLLTFAWSDVVEEVFVAAHEAGKQFRVVLVDSSPKLECQGFTKRLLQRGLHVSYCHVTAVSYIMREATKVFIGAAYVCANGTVVSRNGAAAVAMVARSCSVPVMVCCETYKFHERVQLDAITSNELANPSDLATPAVSKHARNAGGRYDLNPDDPKLGSLRLLNLCYDAMPPEFVTMIVTEVGMLPASAVPAVLREVSESQ